MNISVREINAIPSARIDESLKFFYNCGVTTSSVKNIRYLEIVEGDSVRYVSYWTKGTTTFLEI